jgi:hypothetical protein
MSIPPTAPEQQHLKPLLDAEASRHLSRQLEGVAWGLFFLWMGVAWFSGIGWYWGMIGVGVIFLSEAIIQGVRNLRISPLAVLFGLLFLTGGIWGVASQPFALLPVLFVLFGVAMVVRATTNLFRRG